MRRLLARALCALALLCALSAPALAIDVTIAGGADATFPAYNYAGSTAKLRIYPSQTFTASDSVTVPGGTTPGSTTGFFYTVNCTVASNTLTCPSVTLKSTTDALAGRDTTYTVVLFDANGTKRDFFPLSEFWLSHTNGSTTTWASIAQYNLGARTAPASGYPNFEQMNAAIAAQVNVGNPATTSALGRVKVSSAPADPASPVVVGDNDPRNTNARTPAGAAGGDVAGTFPSSLTVPGLSYRRAAIPAVRLEDTPSYDFAPVALYHPTAGLEVYARRGTKHPTLDAGAIRKWTPAGLADWASASLFDESGSNVDTNNPAGGVTPAGTRILAVARYNRNTSAFTDIRIKRSTDGAAFADVGAMPMVAGASDYSPYGPLACFTRAASAAGFRCLLSAYDLTTGKAWAAYTDDDGLTWSLGGTIVTDTTNDPTEGSLCHISGQDSSAVLLYVTRQEGAAMRQFKSVDSGATWTDMGTLPFSTGGGSGGDVSPWLANMGDGRVTLVWAARSTLTLKTITARHSSVLANVSGWGTNARTIYRSTMDDRSPAVPGANAHFGYPSVVRLGGQGTEGFAVVVADMDASSANTGNADVVDTDLHLLPLSPPPSVSLSAAATQNFPHNASTQVEFGAGAKVLSNTRGDWSPSDPNVVTVSEAGTYQINATVMLSRPGALPTGIAYLTATINNQKNLPYGPVANFVEPVDILGSQKINVTLGAAHPLRAGDKLRLFLYQSSSDAAARTSFAAEFYGVTLSVVRVGN